MERALTDLACPKCGGAMRSQERQGIVVDVCTQCRGIFLDRGERERLLHLEASVGSRYDERDRRRDEGFYDDRERWRDDDDRERSRDDDDPRYRRDEYGRRRRGGFLGELLDFGD